MPARDDDAPGPSCHRGVRAAASLVAAGSIGRLRQIMQGQRHRASVHECGDEIGALSGGRRQQVIGEVEMQQIRVGKLRQRRRRLVGSGRTLGEESLRAVLAQAVSGQQVEGMAGHAVLLRPGDDMQNGAHDAPSVAIQRRVCSSYRAMPASANASSHPSIGCHPHVVAKRLALRTMSSRCCVGGFWVGWYWW